MLLWSTGRLFRVPTRHLTTAAVKINACRFFCCSCLDEWPCVPVEIQCVRELDVSGSVQSVVAPEVPAASALGLVSSPHLAELMKWPAMTKVNIISSHLSPLTLEVVREPQMTLQQYLSTLPCLPLPSGNLLTPFLSIPWCHLSIPSSVFLSFLLLSLSSAELFLPWQRILRCGYTIWVSVSFTMVGIMHASCILDSVVNLLIRHMVFEGNVKKSPITSHLKGLDPSLDFCCQSPQGEQVCFK